MIERRQRRGNGNKNGVSGDSGSPRGPGLEQRLEKVRQEIGFSNDLIIRPFRIGKEGRPAAAVFFDSLVDKNLVGDLVLKAMMPGDPDSDPDADEGNGNVAANDGKAGSAGGRSGSEAERPGSETDPLDVIRERMLPVGDSRVVREWNDWLFGVLCGDTAILADGCEGAIVAGTRGGERRAVNEPSSEVVIRGPKEGFSESISTNIALVRRRLKTPNLWLESFKVGRVSQTSVAILYVKGLANDKIVAEFKKRLRDIDVDGIVESGQIQELIRDNPFSVFPTIMSTERPDSVAAHLLSGRVAMIVDGTPFALVVPITFPMQFASPEDYYQNFHFAIFIRFLRFTGFLISLLGPSLYVAAISYHQEMIPTPLLISLASQREEVPFPALVEALIMEGSFEILREAGVRMPRAIGQAVSIVGAIVLGQAAVQAGIVSSAMVIVVAITGIASFTTPAYSTGIAIRLLRFAIMFSAGVLGFFGIAISGIVLTAHLCSLRSLGVPYMSPFAPFILADQKDSLLRFPQWALRRRPRLIGGENNIRMKQGAKPAPPEDRAGGNESDEG